MASWRHGRRDVGALAVQTGKLELTGVIELYGRGAGSASDVRNGALGMDDVVACFLRAVGRHPDRIAAVQTGLLPMTYRALERRSAILAAMLQDAGVRAGDFVALCADRSQNALIAILAIVRAGGAYVPLDPGYPDRQLGNLLSQTQPVLVLAEKEHCARLARVLAALPGPGRTPVLDIASSRDDSPDRPFTPSIAPDSPIYVLFTSGSTGQPKGVIVPHRAVVRLVHEQDYCSLAPTDVILHFAPLNFDASTFEIWGALLNGGCVAILHESRPSPRAIAEFLRGNRVTTAWLTAGLFHLIVDEDIGAITGLRQLLAGGDVLSPDRVRRFLAAAPSCRLVNGYGPTENTTFTCCADLRSGEWPCASVPIGRAISRTRAWIVDEDFRLLPPGEAGQLVAGGDGLALGYLGDPALTAARFVIAPEPIGCRVYLTGDLARELPDGQFEYLGRMDRQVKIDGKRVEPGEIEDTLRKSAGGREAAVVAIRSESGIVRITGFVCAAPCEMARIEAEARALLPRHMWPACLVAVSAIPLTANGKVDRDALAAMATPAATSTEAPVGEAEEVVASLWRDALGLPSVGRDEAFFELGGRSLQLMRVHAVLERHLGRKIAVAELFARPTVRRMAELLSAEPDPARPALVDETLDRAHLRREAMARRRRSSTTGAMR